MAWEIDGEYVKDDAGIVVGVVSGHSHHVRVNIAWDGANLTHEGTRGEVEAFVKGANEMLTRLTLRKR